MGKQQDVREILAFFCFCDLLISRVILFDAHYWVIGRKKKNNSIHSKAILHLISSSLHIWLTLSELGYIGYIWDYTTQLFGNYFKPMIINNHNKAGFFRSSSWSNMFTPAVKLPALLGHIILDDFRVVFALWSAAFEGHLHRILLCQKTSSWRFCHLTFVLQSTLWLVRC